MDKITKREISADKRIRITFGRRKIDNNNRMITLIICLCKLTMQVSAPSLI